ILSPRELLTRLEHSLSWLVGGSRDLPSRQQTLRATIAWSYDLLNAEQQALMRRLSIFAAPFELEAAASTVDWHPDRVLDALSALVENNLVRRLTAGDGPRFGMFEAVREFSAEALQAENREADARLA